MHTVHSAYIVCRQVDPYFISVHFWKAYIFLNSAMSVVDHITLWKGNIQCGLSQSVGMCYLYLSLGVYKRYAICLHAVHYVNMCPALGNVNNHPYTLQALASSSTHSFILEISQRAHTVRIYNRHVGGKGRKYTARRF